MSDLQRRIETLERIVNLLSSQVAQSTIPAMRMAIGVVSGDTEGGAFDEEDPSPTPKLLPVRAAVRVYSRNNADGTEYVDSTEEVSVVHAAEVDLKTKQVVLLLQSQEGHWHVASAVGGGIRLVRFKITGGSWDETHHTIDAMFYEMDAEDIGLFELHDPEEIFTNLTTDDTGLAIRQDGLYYAIQAPCGDE